MFSKHYFCCSTFLSCAVRVVYTSVYTDAVQNEDRHKPPLLFRKKSAKWALSDQNLPNDMFTLNIFLQIRVLFRLCVHIKHSWCKHKLDFSEYTISCVCVSVL